KCRRVRRGARRAISLASLVSAFIVRDLVYHREMGLFDGTPLQRPVTCAACEKPLTECRCPRNAAGEILLPKDQPPPVGREKRGGGKTVTVITGLDPAASDLAALLGQFKSLCAAGGTVAEGRIEIQGDHREKILARLREMGYPAKVGGG